MNNTNSIKEEVKERIALGTKTYYANLKFFKSKLVTKSLKLKLYRTIIRKTNSDLSIPGRQEFV